MADLHHGDCLEVMRTMADCSVDAVVTDPPYGFGDGKRAGFMGKRWDYDVPSVEVWAECLRVLKPGGHLLAFAGTRTQHRMAVRIEDAGFEIRDMIAWVYGTGFNKVGYIRGDDDQPVRDGWGGSLKPALEPITMARKPLAGTVAANVLEHGTGALNVDGCRVGTEVLTNGPAATPGGNSVRLSGGDGRDAENARRYAETSKQLPSTTVTGRWPANLITDGSDEVVGLFPEGHPHHSGFIRQGGDHFSVGSDRKTRGTEFAAPCDTGSAARFFYTAKASKDDRDDGNTHPTVKPTDLMRYLCRLVTPPGGIVLDPFMGSGSTGKAALLEGFEFIGIEREAQYHAIAQQRIGRAAAAGHQPSLLLA
jgi:site-specific DNA-methyltransferase (adenine-specific)